MEFRILEAWQTQSGVCFRALAEPSAVDAVMVRMTAMSQAGPTRPGLIRMRARDLRLPEIIAPEDFAQIEVADPVGDAGAAGRLHAELGDPEYTVLFAPPALWRWQSRSGASSMYFDDGRLVGTLSGPDALLVVLAALEDDGQIEVTGDINRFVRFFRVCTIVEGLHDPATIADVAPLGAETDPENEPGIVFPAGTRIVDGVSSRPGLIFGPGLEADAAREVAAYCYWPADGYAESAVAIPVAEGDEWTTYRAIRRRLRRPGDKY